MKWTYKLAVLPLVLLAWGAPLMACMLSGDILTQGERECCQQMADDCGSSAMPDSHSCCKASVQQIDSYLANARFDSSFWHPAGLSNSQIHFSVPLTLTQAQPLSQGGSPPLPPLATVSILRI